MLNRNGLSLVELIVAITLAALILGVATVAALHQQRTNGSIAEVAAVDEQLRGAMFVLSGQLQALDAGVGDLTTGEATDTSLQFRAPIGTSVACATGIGAVTLHPDAPGEVALGGTASQIRVSDTLWWYGDSTWTGRRVNTVSIVTAACSTPVATTGQSIRVVLLPTDSIPAGAPLRITRQSRYAIYHASDGTWQMGFREWNDPSSQFSAPQPVVGPLLAAGSRRSGFRYFTALGPELLPTNGPIDVRLVARIRVTARTLGVNRKPGQDSVFTDSTDIALNHATGP